MYIDIIRSGKHLLGEKPFGIDKKANNNIMQVIRDHPDIIVRCVSQYPYYPGSKHIIDWAHEQRYGKIMEVRAGLLHSSDMDPNKKINWKRMLKYNGEYGCMGDLGFHVQHIPFRLGWMPHSVFAHLQNITTSRPDETGTQVPCETWDNALLCCQSTDTATDSTFPINFEVKRMSPGHTNTWYLEIDGTEESIAFSTRNPKALYHLKTTGKQQGWTRYDIGSDFFFPTITAGIFEAGQTDVIQQMIAAFMYEFSSEKPDNFFATATPEETVSSHAVFTAALESWEKGETILLE
jgi:predicted dehydrogenase